MAIQSTPKKLRVAVLGCGFMGTALLLGIIKDLDKSEYDLKFSVSARSGTSIKRLRQTFDSYRDQVDVISLDNADAARGADVVILAFQPQQLAEVLGYRALVRAIQGKLVVSILAGVSSLQVAQELYGSKELTTQTRVSRAIPSIGAQIGESMTLIADTVLSTSDRDLITWLFQRVGPTQLLPEHLINTTTAVSAACHALAVVAVDAIVDGSVAEGVPRPVALNIASQCLRSASTLLREQMTIESLKESMSVARGITINALLQLDRGQVRAGISDAVKFAVQYSNQMSEGSN
ncbi:pyrroline-5-carboxylate reductase [Fonsecaea erecta]|uniref:Pyrroline-5-carboxylate reductase n=1 Tax=Fonsecaea erecta TaxID=1367422 RepID=A0A178ZJX5_9EURO|nr:pyrroline-5-carboxylate reductase [Fonsecaea erecta]OAP59706.1 pyrroline-5-carboxylate reductase [Fonsecaea erecta]